MARPWGMGTVAKLGLPVRPADRSKSMDQLSIILLYIEAGQAIKAYLSVDLRLGPMAAGCVGGQPSTSRC